jgi:hypothetical protein
MPSSARIDYLRAFAIGNRGRFAALTGKFSPIKAGTGAMILADSHPDQQVYLGLDFGRTLVPSAPGRKSLSGAVGGVRGEIASTQYDFFIGTPISKPDDFSYLGGY